MGGSTIRQRKEQLSQGQSREARRTEGEAGPGTQNEVGSLETHSLATGQCPQPSVHHTKAAGAQKLPSAHSPVWDQTLESPIWLREGWKAV